MKTSREGILAVMPRMTQTKTKMKDREAQVKRKRKRKIICSEEERQKDEDPQITSIEEGHQATSLPETTSADHVDDMMDEETELVIFVKAHPAIRVFRYFYIDDKYGSCYPDTCSTLNSLKAGVVELASTNLGDNVRQNKQHLS